MVTLRRSGCLLALLAGSLLAASAASGASELLPDLDANSPSRVSASSATDGSGRVFLTFSASFSNIGKGALAIRGSRASVSEPTIVGDQVITLDDGGESIRPAVGTLTYDEEYRRWGFSPLIAYELRPVGGPVVGVGPDVGFCLVDTRRADPGASTDSDQTKAFRDCGDGKKGLSLLEVQMGVSVGSMNWHKAGKKGQLIDITTLPPGRYVLANRVNSTAALAESSTANNAASVLLEVTRPDEGLPRIEVLRECPDSGKCKPKKKKERGTKGARIGAAPSGGLIGRLQPAR